MRIAVSGFFLDHRPSGLGVYSQNVLAQLVRCASDGHQLTIYAPDAESLTSNGRRNVVAGKVPEFLRPRYGTRAAVARFIWSQTAFPSVLKGKYDLLYSPTHHGILRKGIPQIITIHDLLPMKFPSQYRLQHYYFAHVVPRLIRNSAAIIADSESTRRDVCDCYQAPADRVFVVYSAVDQTFKPAPAYRVDEVRRKYELGDFLLIVGASYPHKNIDRALQAFARVRSELQGIQLVVAGGRADYTKRLKERVEELHVRDVKFTGYVSPEDLPALYSAARLLFYPSLYEGFGLPPLEAMACGCPTIVSKTSSLPEVCGDAAYYVDPYDVESMAEALCMVSTGKDVREGLRHKGFERVKVFSWENTARAVWRVIELGGRSTDSSPPHAGALLG